MSETDAEFLDRLQPSWPGTNDSVRLPMSDFDRLFALARRNYLAEADAAIALVLEEAAKVAESNAPACQDMEGTAIAERCDLIAAAIRALKDQATT